MGVQVLFPAPFLIKHLGFSFSRVKLNSKIVPKFVPSLGAQWYRSVVFEPSAEMPALSGETSVVSQFELRHYRNFPQPDLWPGNIRVARYSGMTGHCVCRALLSGASQRLTRFLDAIANPLGSLGTSAIAARLGSSPLIQTQATIDFSRMVSDPEVIREPLVSWSRNGLRGSAKPILDRQPH